MKTFIHHIRSLRSSLRIASALFAALLAVLSPSSRAFAQLDTACQLECPAPITAECSLPFSSDVDPGQPTTSLGCASGSVGVPDRSIREGFPFTLTGSFEDYAEDTWTATVDFGDGAGPEPLTLAPDHTFHVTHVYADDGRFALRVAVTDDGGAVGEDSSEIVVDNFVPVVSAGPSAALDEGGTFVSEGSFVDTGRDTWTATVDYGDGSGEQPLALAEDGTFALVHAYPRGGEHLVVVTVTDDDGGRGVGTALVTVRNVPPTPVIFVAPGADALDEGQVFSATGTFADPGPGPFTATVDYGDGSGPVALALAADRSFLLQHHYLDDGFFTVTVAVSDGGEVGVARASVVVRNLPPTVDAGPDRHVDEEATVVIAGTVTDPGADGVTATIDWGDASGAAPLPIGPDGSFRAEHVYTIHESYTVRVTVSDGDGAVVVDEVHVLVDNLVPLVDAGMDGSIPEGSTFTQLASVTDRDFDVVSVDIDYGDGSVHDFRDLPAGGATLTLSHVYRDDGVYTIRVVATDQDAAVVVGTTHVTVTGVAPVVDLSGPAHLSRTGHLAVSGLLTDPGDDTFVGTIDFGDGRGLEPLTIDPGRTFVASHDYRANGTYSVVAHIVDDDGLAGTATLLVLVDGLAPSITARISGTRTAPEGSTITLDASGSDDASGGALTFAWDLDGDGAFDDASGPVVTTRADDDTVRTARVRASNAFGASATAEALLTWTNVAPTVAAGGDVIIGVGRALSRTIHLSDPGADVLEALIDAGDGRGPVRSSALPDGTVTFSHVYAVVGDYTVTVVGRDDDGGASVGGFIVHVAGPLICAPGTADCDGDVANGCEATSTSCVPPLPVGCSVPSIASATHGSIDGQGDRDGGSHPVTWMFDGDVATRARYRVGGTQAFVVTVNFAGPVDLDAVRTYTPLGMNTGFAGIRIETSDGSGFVQRYLDTRMFGVVGRFASSAYLGGVAFPAGYVGIAGVVDHVFPGGLVHGVRTVRFTLGWVDEISPDFPGGGDAVYSISEMWFCNSGEPPPEPPVAVRVDAGPDVTVGEGDTLHTSGVVHAPATAALVGSVYWGDGALGDPAAFAEPLALVPGVEPGTWTFSLDHTYGREGVHPLIVSVTDPATGTWSDLKVVTVENRPALLTLADVPSANAGVPLSISGTAVDPGGDGLTLAVDWGDGQTDSVAPIGGAFVAAHTYVVDGRYVLRVTADDGQGGTSEVTREVVVSPCPSGFADCNGSMVDGCESTLDGVDACGACGHVCTAGPNATPLCSSGQCSVVCLAGHHDCDGDAANGCEAAVATDSSNCGACGVACAGTSACVNGVCTVGACPAGYGDCDGDPSNGCEVSIATDPQSCGACGQVCPVGRTCQAGHCMGISPEVCDGVDNDGDGEVDEGLTVPCKTACGAGTIACVGGRWGACSARQPRAETCNHVDDDCDGVVDDVFPSCVVPSCANANGLPPTIAIASPTADAVIGAPIDVVGSVSDTDLDSWSLDVLPAGATSWIQLATGAQVVTNAVLGRIVPGTLPEGIARLRLRAIDCSGTGPAVEVPITIESAEAPGAVRLAFQDLSMELAGVPVEITRRYDSRERAEPKDFGYGWSMEVNTRSRISRNLTLGAAWAVSCW